MCNDAMEVTMEEFEKHLDSLEEKKNKLIAFYRDKMPKRNWTEIKDEYEVIDGHLCVWGANGTFYRMNYESEDNWSITFYPRDIYGTKEWKGYGRGWEEV